MVPLRGWGPWLHQGLPLGYTLPYKGLEFGGLALSVDALAAWLTF